VLRGDRCLSRLQYGEQPTSRIATGMLVRRVRKAAADGKCRNDQNHARHTNDTGPHDESRSEPTAGGRACSAVPAWTISMASIVVARITRSSVVNDCLRNSEIAARLFLVDKTVDHDVSAILRKLAVRTRGEAVAVMLQNRPTLLKCVRLPATSSCQTEIAVRSSP
jgi:DNA-binding CsgD family transcriptional regulator